MPSFLRKRWVACLACLVALGGVSSVWAGDRAGRRTPAVRVVEKVGPAVVNIFTEEAPRTARNPFGGFFGDSFFERFFKFDLPRRKTRRSLGSGVLIHPQGYILTNEHVIAQAVRIQVTLQDKREFEAQLIGGDARSDLAVIKIDSDQPFPYIPMGHSHDLMIGETVIAIGNPLGLSHTVTQGIISALHRTIHASRNKVLTDFIQVDASINPGNSGGPLLNIHGELIGINTAIIQDAQGIGFAIPIDSARRIVNDLIEYGAVRRGWLGVAVQDLNPDLARYFKLERAEGVLVTRVYDRSPAARAGIRRGDILLSIDDHPVLNKSDYFQALSSYTVDDVFQLVLQRDGSQKTLRLKVASIPPDFAEEFALQWLGIRVKDIDRATAGKYHLAAREGVVIHSVRPESACGRVGIRPGDVIRRVNRDPIRNIQDFHKAIVEAGKLSSVVLLVQRGRSGYYVTLEP